MNKNEMKKTLKQQCSLDGELSAVSCVFLRFWIESGKREKRINKK